jgi:integrase
MLKPFLVRRGSTWHLRLRLRGFEFWKSLKTSSRRIAVLRSKIAALTLYQVAMMNDEDLLLKAHLKLAESMDALADLPVTVPMRKAGDDPAESSVDLLIKNEAAKRAGKLKADSKAEPKADPAVAVSTVALDGSGASTTQPGASTTLQGASGRSETTSVTLRVAFDQYMREGSHRRPRGQGQIKRALERFMKQAGLTYESPVNVVLKSQCVRFKTMLLEGGAKVATVNHTLMLLQHFLKWCRSCEYIATLPTEGLKMSARARRATSIKKEAFTDEEMRLILTHPHLTKRKEGRWRETYQCATLIVCSGARSSEITQLLVSDVRLDSGVWYVNIEEDQAQGKFVKNAASRRTIPLHSAFLKATGFLEYVADMKQASKVKLFPSICTKTPTLMTEFFNRLLRKHCGIVTKTKTQHSFRHWLNVALARANVNPAIRHRILGHAQGQGVGDTVYLASLDFSVKELSAAMEMVRLPLEKT